MRVLAHLVRRHELPAYDSLGEAYMLAGEKEPAIRSYRRSLDLNPDNQNGKDMLQRLQ